MKDTSTMVTAPVEHVVKVPFADSVMGVGFAACSPCGWGRGMILAGSHRFGHSLYFPE